MRIRSRTSYPNLNNTWASTTQTWRLDPSTGTWYASGVPVLEDGTISLWPSNSFVEVMHDWSTVGSSRRGVQVCRHTKSYLRERGSPFSYQVWLPGATKRVVYDYSSGLVFALSTLYGMPPQNVNTLLASYLPEGAISGRYADFLTLKGSFDEKINTFLTKNVSAGENIAEPDVFVEAIKLCLSPRKFLREFVHVIRKNYGTSFHNKLLGPVVKQVSKDVAGGYLKWVFGYKPVISDLQAAFAAHREVQKRMAYLDYHKGHFVSVKARQKLSQTTPADSYSFAGSASDIHCLQFDNEGYLAISCEARVRKDITPFDTFKAYAQYFGIHKVIGLAWELIPYSFVADWVLNLDSYIDKHTRLDFGTPFSETRGFCFTHKEESGRRYFLSKGSLPGGKALMTQLDVADFVHTSYSREITPPDELLQANLSRWGSFQNVTSGALLLQKFLK